MGQVLFFGKDPKPVANTFMQQRQIHVMLCKGMNITRTGIYRLWFNEMFYIGRSNNIRKRVKQHMKEIQLAFHNNKPKGWFHANVIKFLTANPEFSIIKVEILEECEERMLNEREQYYLDKYGSELNCLNVAITASQTWRDKARNDFKAGIYRVDYNIQSEAQFIAFKSILKHPCVVNHEFVGMPDAHAQTVS